MREQRTGLGTGQPRILHELPFQISFADLDVGWAGRRQIRFD